VIGTAAGNDARVAVPAYLALTLCLLGRCDAARRQSELALAEARRAQRPHRLAFALSTSGWLHLLLREDASGVTEELAALARDQAFPYWAGVATLFRAGTAAREGRRAEAAALLEEGMQTFRAIGTASVLPWWAALVAPMLEASRAEDLLDEQLRRIEATDERWCEAEVRRACGEVARRRGDPGRARSCFEEAIAIARRQEALYWELRAACSLARLWAEAGERRRAQDLLAPVYGRFTEGFDTPDLQDAKALLDVLR
jgi:hypothetical protein